MVHVFPPELKVLEEISALFPFLELNVEGGGVWTRIGEQFRNEMFKEGDFFGESVVGEGVAERGFDRGEAGGEEREKYHDEKEERKNCIKYPSLGRDRGGIGGGGWKRSRRLERR